MSARVVGIGEILWDLLPTGPQLGGAPANFAYHAHALGADARIISRIGRDLLGERVLARFRELGLPEDTIQYDETAATGTVLVSLTAGGLPEYTIKQAVAWDGLEATPTSRQAVRTADAVCFGSLAQRNETSRSAIRKLVTESTSTAWRVLDLNLRQHFFSRELIQDSLSLANALKLNDDELNRLGTIFELEGDPRSCMVELARQYRLRVVACTRGPRGSLILADGRWSDHPGVPVEVADTVGAGDAFTAAMILGLLAQWDLEVVNQRANEVASFVASCSGATPKLPESLARLFKASL